MLPLEVGPGYRTLDREVIAFSRGWEHPPEEPPDEVANSQTEREREQGCSRPVYGRVAQPRVAAFPARNPTDVVASGDHGAQERDHARRYRQRGSQDRQQQSLPAGAGLDPAAVISAPSPAATATLMTTQVAASGVS